MTDIVERLRDPKLDHDCLHRMVAADTIESLRQQLAECRADRFELGNNITIVAAVLAECRAKAQKYRGDIASYIAMEQGEDAAANYLAKELE